MINHGPVQIGTNIEHIEGVGNRHITIVTPVTPEDQSQPSTPAASSAPKHRKAPAAGTSNIRLSDVKGKKIGFIRVIKALHKEGFFESVNGGSPTEDDVYAAFGIAVGEGLADYSAQLSNNRNDTTPATRAEVFKTLHDTYQSYEQKIDDDKEAREADNRP